MTVIFFVMFSTTSGLTGQYGQADYAAANTLSDVFLQYLMLRKTLALSWIPQVSSITSSFSQRTFMSEEDMLEVVRLAIARSCPAGMIRPLTHIATRAKLRWECFRTCLLTILKSVNRKGAHPKT